MDTVNKRDVLENFETQFKKSTLPLVVLELLSEREMYPYEISQEALRRSDGRYKAPLLYNIIKKLQEQGFVVVSRKETSVDNRTRIYYKATKEGLAYLEKLKSIYAELSQVIQDMVYDNN
ncbi:PadR family transcriptional regulator PadR [Clostridiales Family XIII bacterium PM5-7]